MVNDALYGILYRDINIVRGLIDQRVSRMINGYFGVVINTGEDNYLRTADAIEAAPSVTASQFINHQLARDSGVPDAQIALGRRLRDRRRPSRTACCTSGRRRSSRASCSPTARSSTCPPPGTWTATSSARTPPTRCSTSSRSRPGRASRRSACRPRASSRRTSTTACSACRTSTTSSTPPATSARRSSSSAAGIIQTRAQEVLGGAHALLERIAEDGLFKAIEEATFGDVSRRHRRGPRHRGDRRDRARATSTRVDGR